MTEEPDQTERLLMVELFKLGQQISSFVLKAMGTDIEKAGSPSAEEKWQLGRRLVESGRALQQHAESQVKSNNAAQPNGHIVDKNRPEELP